MSDKVGNLTGQEIFTKGIVTKVPSENVAQHGIDLNLIKVERIDETTPGFVPYEGKTKLAGRIKVELQTMDDGSEWWYLEPGSYDITLEQGCKIPSNMRARIVQRSSLLRNGTILSSSMFDAGFYTDNIGTVMKVDVPIYIEYKARVGQFYVSESNQVNNLYDGQWQNDNQRLR